MHIIFHLMQYVHKYFYRFYSYHSVYFLLQLHCAQVNQDLCITISTNKLHNEDLEAGGREKQKSIIPPHQILL